MNKTEFVLALTERLAGIPWEEVEDRIHFYIEAIDDRMEEGLDEAEAVAALGTVDEIAGEILADIPLPRLIAKKIKPKRRLRAGEIVLLSVGAPLWFPLLIAAVSVLLALYLSVWAIIVSLWSVPFSLLGCSVGGMIAGLLFVLLGNGISGLAMIGAALVSAGLGIFSLFGCKAATKGILMLTKKTALAIKNLFVKKEAAHE